VGELVALDPTVRVLVLTGYQSEQLGIEALHRGAASFLSKPIDAHHLHSLLADGVSFSQLKRKFLSVTRTSETFERLTGLKSNTPAMQHVLEQVDYLATCDLPVLIYGETGTGKGVIADAIHRAHRTRRGAFIRFQPSFLGADLIASELFGHQKGAFTGATENRKGLIEEADGGTLFIDELSELPVQTQVLLLDVLQTGTFRRVGSNRELTSNFRLIAATNQHPEKLLQNGRLRLDFFHRISHAPITLPPLRERKDDIPDLVNLFLRQLTNRGNLTVNTFTPAALDELKLREWPGNVRELQAVVENGVHRASYLGERAVLPNHLQLFTRGPAAKLSFRDRVRSFELQLIDDALRLNNNSQRRAAESLGLDRTTLRRILSRVDD
jgi:DNA-binding NtrC family response regulator